MPSSQQLQGSPKGGSALTGQYQHSIDAKGRVFIPAKLREELGETFYVTMGMDSCLSVYSDASWAKFTEKFESLPYTKTKAMRPLFANAAKCEPDSQGRILLPQKLRAYAGMNKPSSSQINYIDLSAPDSVELCEAQNVSVLSRVFTSLGQGVFSVVEYFS